MAKAKPFSYYMPEEVEKELDIRGKKHSPTITRDLMRLYDTYHAALLEVPLTINEAYLLTESLKDESFDANNAQLLHTAVVKAIRSNNLEVKYKVDTRELAAKLRGLSVIQCLAIIDAVERAYEVSSEGSAFPTEETIKKIFCL